MAELQSMALNNISLSTRVSDAEQVRKYVTDAIDAGAPKLSAFGLEYESGEEKKITLSYDGRELASIDASDFVKDGMISSVSFDDQTYVLKIVWNSDGDSQVTEINLSGLIDTYTAGEGLALENGEFSLTAYIPDKMSDLSDDVGYLTEHQSLSGYYQKSETSSAAEIGAGILSVNAVATEALVWADRAEADAHVASDTANEAHALAAEAIETSTAAQTIATNAENKALEAKETSLHAEANAANAYSKATAAETNAVSAYNTANTAEDTAAHAYSTATDAENAATRALSMANDALATAQTTAGVAEDANRKAEQAAVIAQTADATAAEAHSAAADALARASAAEGVAINAHNDANIAHGIAVGASTKIDIISGDLSSYYRKSETSSAAEIDGALAGKQPSGDYVQVSALDHYSFGDGLSVLDNPLGIIPPDNKLHKIVVDTTEIATLNYVNEGHGYTFVEPLHTTDVAGGGKSVSLDFSPTDYYPKAIVDDALSAVRQYGSPEETPLSAVVNSIWCLGQLSSWTQE